MKNFKIITISTIALALIFGIVPIAKADNLSNFLNVRGSATENTKDGQKGSAKVKMDARINAQMKGNTTADDSAVRNSGNDSTKDKMERNNFGLASTTVSSRNIVELKAKADREINNRINSLNKLQTRIKLMTKISDTQKTSIIASIQASITEMTNLKAKIDAETDITALKSEIASISASYRIYALVMPQISILVAADRMNTIADMMTTIGVKLQARINAAGVAGTAGTVVDATATTKNSLQVLMNDYNAKIADARIQAQTAQNLVLKLTPDNGDKTKKDANNQTLRDAKAKIKAGNSDLKAARKDARDIFKGLGISGVIHSDGSLKASTQI